MKPTKPLSKLLQVDGKMEKNGLEFPVNNEESILSKSSGGVKKNNDVENGGYQRRNVACDDPQTCRAITLRSKLKIQQKDKGNSLARNSKANAQDYSLEARNNYEQNSSSTVANQPFILGYSSATPDIHTQDYSSEVRNKCEQNLSSAVANQPFILRYPSATPDNHQHNLLSAVINQPLILGYSSATPDNCQQCWPLAVANQLLAPFILGTCQVLIPYYCGIPTYSMLI